MAKPIADGKQLSWHKAAKQWYRSVPVEKDANDKIIKKRKYFGSGTNKSDRKGYRKALERYEKHMQDWAVSQAARVVVGRIGT